MPNITHLSVKKDVPPTGYWDHAFLDDMLKGLGKSDRHVFIIPGKNQCSSESIWKINMELTKHKKVLVFVTSDILELLMSRLYIILFKNILAFSISPYAKISV